MPINNIAKKVRFLGVDGLVVLPMLIIMVFPTKFMLYTVLIFAIVLFLLEKRGISLFMFFRKIRSTVAGRHRFIRPPWRGPIVYLPMIKDKKPIKKNNKAKINK